MVANEMPLSPALRPVVFSITAVLAAALPAAAAEEYVFSTLAGTPSFNHLDGTGSNARFGMPEEIAVDSAGNLYVTDYMNHAIRKITPAGVVTTVAGWPSNLGSADGIGTAAALGLPSGIAVDSAQNLYVTDSYKHSIRKITPAGVVTTIAGTGVSGNNDGPATTARFSTPEGIAIDAQGNLFIADTGNSTVRKLSPDGIVTTVAGTAGVYASVDGVGAAARFRAPYGIAVDRSGTLFVTDWDDSTVRKIAADGTVTTVAGLSARTGYTDGPGTSARFVNPAAIDIDSAGNLYVADRGASNIRKLTPGVGGYTVTTFAGLAGIRGTTDGVSNVARFYRSAGIAVDSANNVFVADSFNCTIRKLDSSGFTTTLAGKPGSGAVDGVRTEARFFLPSGMVFDRNGDLFVAESGNHTIRKITPGGTVSTVAGSALMQGSTDGVGTAARFRYPYGLAFDASGNLFIADSSNHCIRKMTPDGMVSTFTGQAMVSGTIDGVGTAARFAYPTELAFDANGNLWVSDSANHTIRKITPDGTVTTIAGIPGTSGSSDGPAAQARFYSPRGLAFDSAGNLYIADSVNDVIRKMTPAGMVSTLAGVARDSGISDGGPTTARFNGPVGITVGRDGFVYVAERDSHAIRKITPEGTVTTVGGNHLPGSSDGIRPFSQFWEPAAIALDAIGNVYVADGTNHTLRRGGRSDSPEPSARLFNLSVRADILSNKRLMTGFVLAGNAKPVLIRAVGPGLAPYVGTLQTAGNPRLEIYDSASLLVQTNEDWGGTAELRNAFASVGAFPISDASLDAAAQRSITGLHTAHVISPTAGAILVEAYDRGSGTTARLINVSARYDVTANPLIAGFNVEGTGQKTVLIRGVGPSLVRYGVPDAIRDPIIEVYTADGQKIASNNDWPQTLAPLFRNVGAFDLNDSKDAALLISLPRGGYTAQLSSAAGTGEGLIEIYEVGN